jgi:hypothetical protein
MRDTRDERTAAVRTSGTTLAGIFGVGPIIIAAAIHRRRHHRPSHLLSGNSFATPLTLAL